MLVCRFVRVKCASIMLPLNQAFNGVPIDPKENTFLSKRTLILLDVLIVPVVKYIFILLIKMFMMFCSDLKIFIPVFLIWPPLINLPESPSPGIKKRALKTLYVILLDGADHFNLLAF